VGCQADRGDHEEQKVFTPRPSNFKFCGAIPTKRVVEILVEKLSSWLEKFLKKADDQDSLADLAKALGECISKSTRGSSLTPVFQERTFNTGQRS
jgi:hypothetical protein